MYYYLQNLTTDQIIAEKAWCARTFVQKAKGLLGKRGMHRNEALFIPECRSIHTCFMKFPIDVFFVDAEDMALKIQYNIKPFRFVWGPMKAKGVWEFPAHTLCDKVHLGDKVKLVNGINT